MRAKRCQWRYIGKTLREEQPNGEIRILPTGIIVEGIRYAHGKSVIETNRNGCSGVFRVRRVDLEDPEFQVQLVKALRIRRRRA